ncbi:MAG: hypothetical protein B6I23_01450 [Rickettsiaceae bacterium 4572_127]|nr:MAG: hypothetical protein B6I23_01450 [Rickettsiaceae bacterium 4572_127]
MKKPKLSIIIPTYSVDKYLHECLDSVVNQTYKNLEIIIIDDVSKDSTPQIIREYAKKDKRIKAIFHKKNKGPGATRNEGLKLATGKYVTLMDHDDWQDLSKYEKMIQRAEKTQADMVFCNAEEFDETTGKTFTLYKEPKDFREKEIVDIQNWNKKDFIFRTFIPPWTRIIKLDFILKYGIQFAEDGNKFDDVLFHYLSVIFAKKVSYIDEVLYTHRFFSGSISGQVKQNRDMFFDDFKTWNDIERICEKNKFSPKKVFGSFIKIFASHLYKVGDSSKYANEVQKIIKKLELNENDFPKTHKKYYKKIMSYSKFKKELSSWKKRLFSVRINPKKSEYQLVLFGVKIL